MIKKKKDLEEYNIIEFSYEDSTLQGYQFSYVNLKDRWDLNKNILNFLKI